MLSPTSTKFSLTSLTLDNSYFGDGVLPAHIEQSRSTLVSLIVGAPSDYAYTPADRLAEQLLGTGLAPNLKELYVGIKELQPFVEACTSLEILGTEGGFFGDVMMWDLPKSLRRMELSVRYRSVGNLRGKLPLPARAKLEEMERQGLVLAGWELRFFLSCTVLLSGFELTMCEQW